MNPTIYFVFELIQSVLMIYLFALMLGDDRKKRNRKKK